MRERQEVIKAYDRAFRESSSNIINHDYPTTYKCLMATLLVDYHSLE